MWGSGVLRPNMEWLSMCASGFCQCVFGHSGANSAMFWRSGNHPRKPTELRWPWTRRRRQKGVMVMECRPCIPWDGRAERAQTWVDTILSSYLGTGSSMYSDCRYSFGGQTNNDPRPPGTEAIGVSDAQMASAMSDAICSKSAALPCVC